VLLDTIRSHPRPAIVYASTRTSVERIAKQLTRSGSRLRALPYHAGLDDVQRHATQEAFMKGECDTIVATNAFGMGIDKSDVRLVVHYAMPGTVEAYYQEAGRAGRDGGPSRCVLLHAYKDRLTHEWFIHGMYPERASVEKAYATFCATHVAGRIARIPPGREVESAIRLLEQEHVVIRRRTSAKVMHVRLLATPSRIRRELGGPSSALELGVLRSLWRVAGSALEGGVAVNLYGLPPGIGGRTAQTVLERLRGRQFVDAVSLDEGLYLARPDRPLADFAIDWAAMARRRAADLEKLQMMQNYASTKQCRRAFVLRYFGETRASRRCGGCDNCHP
jgi:ATP-dependent DNA helicase RecQ